MPYRPWIPDPTGAQPGSDADHIAVDGRLRLSERDRSDRSGRILSDSRKLSELSGILGKLSAVLLHDQTCSFLKIAGTAVVAKPFPKLEKLILRTGRKTFDIGERGKKALVISADCLYTRLLQHDLRDPYPVRILCLPPRQ